MHPSDKTFIREVMSSLEELDVISFDIFDTAVTRVLDSPADVFAVLEEALVVKFGKKAEGFAIARETSEALSRNSAWAKGYEDVSFDEIYSSIQVNFPSYAEICDDAQRIEWEIELDVMRPVPAIQSLVQQIKKQGKIVIFVSDMYHSSEYLQRLLHNCGYQSNEDIFVSSETRLTKSSGNQWKYILGLYPDKRILHIGDDIHADVETPKDYGVKTKHFSSSVSERRVSPKFSLGIRQFSLIRRSAEMEYRSIGNSSVSDWWYSQGASTGAIILYAFCKWLKNKSESLKIEHLYFCARDGHLIQKAWEAAGFNTNEITDSYLHVSRRPLNFASGYLNSSSRKISPSFLEFLSTSWGKITIRLAIERISFENTDELLVAGKYFFENIDAPLTWQNKHLFFDFLQKHASTVVYDSAKTQYMAIVGYLAQEGVFESRRSAIVDLGWTGSLQTSLNQIRESQGLKEKVSGFYYGLWPDAAGKRYSAGWMEAAFGSDFRTFQEQAYLRNAVDILESIHCSNEGTVTSYEKSELGWKPITNQNVIEQQQYELCVEPFQRGVINSIRTWAAGRKVAGVSSDEINIDVALATLAALTLSPSRSEVTNYGQLQYCPTFEHANFNELIHRERPADIDKAEQILNIAAWPIGTMRYWIATYGTGLGIDTQELAKRSFGHIGDRILRQFV
ncbi:hypothetical protein BKD02_02600 [Brucella sp. 09RB8910]|nr:hypothetical protein BKD02_02600 [Brucella sp. 09RB8910]